MRSYEVFGTIERIYSRAWYIKKEEDLENAKRLIAEFEEMLNTKVRK